MRDIINFQALGDQKIPQMDHFQALTNIANHWGTLAERYLIPNVKAYGKSCISSYSKK